MMVVLIDSQLAGISGDMLLSSLVNIGADKSKILHGIETAQNFLSGSSIKKIEFKNVKKNGIDSTSLTIELEEEVKERLGKDIQKCIQESVDELKLSQKGKDFSISSIETLMMAESKIHGEPIDSVHFHEASSFDTVIDILGSAIALEDLGFFDEEIISSPVAVGGGTTTFTHGTTTNPAGAILEILKNSGILISGGTVKDELTTPTGASMLVNLSKSCSEFYPQMKVSSIGYGAGKKNFKGFSNVLKIVRGDKLDNFIYDSVKVLETNVDDVSGEILGNFVEKIMKNGAKDVTISSAITKKGRPTNLISVICDHNSFNAILNLLISETGTLGVRVSTSERYIVPRSLMTISLNLGGKTFKVRYKTNNWNNLQHFKIEYEDVKIISESLKKSYKETEEIILSLIKEKTN